MGGGIQQRELRGGPRLWMLRQWLGLKEEEESLDWWVLGQGLGWQVPKQGLGHEGLGHRVDQRRAR